MVLEVEPRVVNVDSGSAKRYPVLDGRVQEFRIFEYVRQDPLQPPSILYGDRVFMNSLSPVAKRGLPIIIQDSRNIQEVPVLANTGLVVYVAKKEMLKRDIGSFNLSDLVQEGFKGLMRAVEKFDHNRGTKLATYATWWIRHSITRALEEASLMIRLPVHLQEELRKAGVQTDYVQQVTLQPVSLNRQVKHDGVEGDELGALIEDPGQLGELSAIQSRIAVEMLLPCLGDQEKKVITLRFGLEDGEAKTLEEVGAIMGLTRERIRQIEVKALGKMRSLLNSG
jgi:RNA polymerase primary sigma factor